MADLLYRFLICLLAITFLGGESIIMAENKESQDERTVWINGSMGKLYALLEMPELPENGKCPMVIFCHGFRGSLDFPLWEPIIRNLNAHGIGALRFDFNGAGKSEGEFKDMTVPNEIDDLMAVISYVASLPTTLTVSLVGHSQGGVVCGMAAGKCGAEQIKSLVLLSAAAVLRDDALRGNTMGTIYDPWHLKEPDYPLEGGFRLGRDYIQTAMNLPIYKTTADYKGPTLIMTGMADQVVPYTYAQRYKDVLADSNLLIVPGENHRWTVNPDYPIAVVSDWLTEKLTDNK